MFAKKLFLIASQNSQENNCTGVFLLMQLQARIRHRCSPVNFALFLRRAFLQNTSGHLLLYFTDSARSKKILRRRCDVISVVHKLSCDAVMQTSFYRRLHGVFNPASFSRSCNDIWFGHQKSRSGYVVPQSSFRRLWPLGCVRVKVTEDFLTAKNTKNIWRALLFIFLKNFHNVGV